MDTSAQKLLAYLALLLPWPKKETFPRSSAASMHVFIRHTFPFLYSQCSLGCWRCWEVSLGTRHYLPFPGCSTMRLAVPLFLSCARKDPGRPAFDCAAEFQSLVLASLCLLS